MNEAALQAVLRQGEELINNREFEAARIFLEQTSKEWFSYSKVLFLLALAQRLCGNAVEADRAWQQARECPDHSGVLEGDFLRDAVLAQIRNGEELQDAQRVLNAVYLAHRADPDRTACAHMVQARLHAAQKNYFAACVVYLKADNEWAELAANGAPVTWQWVYLNLVHFTVNARRAGNLLQATRLLRRILGRYRQLNRGNRKLALWASLHVVLGEKLATWLSRLLKIR